LGLVREPTAGGEDGGIDRARTPDAPSKTTSGAEAPYLERRWIAALKRCATQNHCLTQNYCPPPKTAVLRAPLNIAQPRYCRVCCFTQRRRRAGAPALHGQVLAHTGKCPPHTGKCPSHTGIRSDEWGRPPHTGIRSDGRGRASLQKTREPWRARRTRRTGRTPSARRTRRKGPPQLSSGTGGGGGGRRGRGRGQ
jgi:hypothetical protein